MPRLRVFCWLSLCLLFSSCRGTPGPACQLFIHEFAKICGAAKSGERLCREEFVRQIGQLKRQSTTAAADEICKQNAQIFEHLTALQEKAQPTQTTP